jgi:hypothetical protein
MFIGVHTLDQVIFGCSIGIWFAFTANFIVKEPMLRWADKILYNNQEQISNKDFTTPAIIVAIVWPLGVLISMFYY